MICKLGGFITQRHNELRDLEAEFLSMVCSDVEIEPVLQDISGDQLNRGSHWRSGCEVISTHVGSGSAIDRHSSMQESVTLMLYRINRFHCQAIKKCIRNRSLEVSKKMKCYKRLICKQFVQESGLCDPQFLSYFPKRFTHLCRALYGDAILVYRFGAPTWPAEMNKNMWSSFFLQKPFLFIRELVYVHISISSNTWNGYTVENQEVRLFFNETAFLFWCHVLWNSEVQIAVFSKWNLLREWKLVQRFTFCLSSTWCQ